MPAKRTKSQRSVQTSAKTGATENGVAAPPISSRQVYFDLTPFQRFAIDVFADMLMRNCAQE